LANRTVCVVGLGIIATALAQRCLSFDMRVIGVTTQPRHVEGFDRVYSRSQMAEAFAESDFVVILTPYSAETHHMIDAAAIGSIRPDSYLINLARGGVVDEGAVLDALHRSAIAGAAMDVFETEPLPAENPLWEAPNLIVTSHMGGFSDCYPEQLAPIIEHNLRCVLSGRLEQMQNRVLTLQQQAIDRVVS
jgi:phosphoglycerate dehydrogenase-like enzyme